MALLEIHDLHTFFKTKKGIVKAVNGVSYSVEPGKTLGVVGESGSGKSVSAMSILKLLDGNGYIDSGEIIFDGKNLADVSVKDMCKIRGNEISVIFQEPMTSLNPIFTVERQLSEPFIIHQGMNKKEAAVKVVEMLKDVRIPNPEAVAKQYPHQLSGGMRQRVMIAMALACRPKLLIADEPTTALDVTIQAQILKLMNDLNTFGLYFEALCERDLRIYAESIDAKLYHYRENTTGMEVDAIVEIADGEYGAIEIKLGSNKEEEAAETLKKFYEMAEVKPKFMCIICGLYDAVVRRPDGIYVLPITVLKT